MSTAPLPVLVDGNLLLRADFRCLPARPPAATATMLADHRGGLPASVPADMGTLSRGGPRIDRKVDSGSPAGPPGAKDSAARERILTTAYGLFCRHGIGAVGVDTIIDQSGVAKMTLYRHFRSKDDLVLAVLERREELWTRQWLVGEVKRRASDPAERLLAIFDVFDGWFRRRSFEGCLFVNALLEIEDRKHPIHQASREQLARHPVLHRGPGARRRRARTRALRPPVAHPHEGLDRGRGRGRRRRRPPGPGHGAAAPGPHARPAPARRRHAGLASTEELPPGDGVGDDRGAGRARPAIGIEGAAMGVDTGSAGEPAGSRRPRGPLEERVRQLMSDFSIEVTPREVDKLPPLDSVLAPSTAVFITWLPNAGFEGTVACARRVHGAGLVPVPHLAARAVRSEAEIDDVVGALAGEGVTRVLVIAGSVKEVAGPFPATIDLLRTGILQRHGMTHVGVAGHPEGSPDVDPADLVQAIVDKNAFAMESGLEMEIVTQFSFAPEPVMIWERALGRPATASRSE